MVKNHKHFQNIAIYTSLDSKKVQLIAEQLVEVLSNLEVRCLFPSSSKLGSINSNRELSDKTIIKRADLVIAIGGDGTLLSSARRFGYYGLPILGINLGSLGFLTDIPPKDLTSSLNKVLKGEFIRDKRIFLEASIGSGKQRFQALNEVVLHSGSIAQLMEYDLFINEEFVYRQKADGLIVSSPTGSTAYSLSGNGPIISPDVQAITLLPMFPHSLNARTLIISQLDNIRLTIRGDSKAYLSLDSHNNIKLDSKSNVNIYKAERELTLIHPTDHSFFSSCRDKLGWSLGIPVSNTL